MKYYINHNSNNDDTVCSYCCPTVSCEHRLSWSRRVCCRWVTLQVPGQTASIDIQIELNIQVAFILGIFFYEIHHLLHKKDTSILKSHHKLNFDYLYYDDLCDTGSGSGCCTPPVRRGTKCVILTLKQ